MDIFLSPKSQTFLLFFPPPLGDHFFESFHSSATPSAPYSSSPNVCRRHGTSEPVAGSYSWSLKSSIPLLFFFGGEPPNTSLSSHFLFVLLSSQRLNLSVSLVSPSFYAFFLQRLAFISFQSLFVVHRAQHHS